MRYYVTLAQKCVSFVVHPLEQAFAHRLKQLRNDQNWSQARLAEESGLSDREIRHLERGDRWPKADTLERLARAFRLHPKDLLDFPWP